MGDARRRGNYHTRVAQALREGRRKKPFTTWRPTDLQRDRIAFAKFFWAQWTARLTPLPVWIASLRRARTAEMKRLSKLRRARWRRLISLSKAA